ncbi:hypothetical protein MMC10_000290 [Thelotrema lepadinum]|nr:hypothetical protein [Thelotrema lepadinum]
MANNQDHTSNSTSQIFRLFIDARTSFPYTSTIGKAATKAWASTPRVAAALKVLPQAEQVAVCRFYKPSDAALSLCSHLLKRLAIVRGCNVPWNESEISQERETNNGKPYYKKGGVEFNVSHHGEIVALVATTAPGVHVGIDVVQVDLARDRRGVEGEKGFEGWVQSFKDVFSENEFRTLRNLTPGSFGPDSEETLKMKLRRFHLNWALKEAYIKMTGDALMAQWLQQLEFVSVMPPSPVQAPYPSKWTWGETMVTGVTLHGKPVEGVRIEVDALREDYMVATAVNDSKAVPSFEQVEISEDATTLKCLGPGATQLFHCAL